MHQMRGKILQAGDFFVQADFKNALMRACFKAPITQLFSGNELDKFTEYLSETSLMNDKFEAIQDGSSEVKKRDEHVANTVYQF